MNPTSQTPWFICQHIRNAQFCLRLIQLKIHLALFIPCSGIHCGLNINTDLWSKPNCWQEMFSDISTKLDVYSYRRAHRHPSFSAGVLCKGCSAVTWNTQLSMYWKCLAHHLIAAIYTVITPYLKMCYQFSSTWVPISLSPFRHVKLSHNYLFPFTNSVLILAIKSVVKQTRKMNVTIKFERFGSYSGDVKNSSICGCDTVSFCW
jgi:hypothetical protein